MKLILIAVLASSLVLTSSFVGANVADGSNSITDIVASSGGEFDNNPLDYDILLNAVITADLAGALADETAELTVFAPNDRAFMRLASDLGWSGGSEADAWVFLVAALTDLGSGDPVPVLTNVLLYHVVGDRLSLPDIVQGGPKNTIITLVGATIKPKGTRLNDNEPNLADPRLLVPSTFFASNGNIFTIDRVLIPLDLP